MCGAARSRAPHITAVLSVQLPLAHAGEDHELAGMSSVTHCLRDCGQLVGRSENAFPALRRQIPHVGNLEDGTLRRVA